jgi:hypothetical protein
MRLGKITSSDLALLLSMYSSVMAEAQEAQQLLKDKAKKIFAADLPKPTWCQYYELPVREHFSRLMVGLGIGDELTLIAQAPNQVQQMNQVMADVGPEIDAWAPTVEEMSQLQRNIGVIYAMLTSVTMSMRSLMTYGCYINDLVAAARVGGVSGDKALLAAVKIDPTVLGCVSVVSRVSQAVMLDDSDLLGKVRKAMAGKLTKREQKNYQMMRMVLQVLHETGAANLGQEGLYKLFVEELKLIRGDTDTGNVANALRQFAYQFFKCKAVS